MCFDPISIGGLTITAGQVATAAVTAALSAAATGVAGYLSTRNQNEAAVQQYKYQQKQQRLINQSVVDQYQEQGSRLRLDAQRQGQQALEQEQTNVLDLRKRQAAALANASTAGITGTPLDMLFNDFQVAVGGVATNLQTNYQQINENIFFTQRDSQRAALSKINSATPAEPYLAQFSALPALLSGISTGVGSVNFSNTPKPNNNPAPTPTPQPTPVPNIADIDITLPPVSKYVNAGGVYQGWRFA